MKHDPVAALRYTRALFEAAQRRGETEKVEADLRELVGVLGPSGLERFVASPRIAPAQKKKALDRVGTMLRSRLATGFLLVLLKKSRLGILAAVSKLFTALWQESRDIVTCEAVFAGESREPFRGKLAEMLGRVTSKHVRLVTRQDPELVGGFVVKIGNRLIDASVRSRLLVLKRQLMATQVH